VDDDFGRGLLERHHERIFVANIADERSHSTFHIAQAEQARLCRRQKRIARKLRSGTSENPTQPRPLKAGMPGQKYSFPFPKG
jgi:hypothetical protein